MLFSRKKSIAESDLLRGGTDNHSHILYGVDDGVRTLEESLSILSYYEELGVRHLWLTPHIMEDVPNRTEDLRERFRRFSKEEYSGPVQLSLAAEYMMDNLYESRLREDDLLTHGEGYVMVETSPLAPPLDLWGLLSRTLSKGYRPILAHPERYRYMIPDDYARLHKMGVLLQLNLPSVAGYYGGDVIGRAHYLLEKGWYTMFGSDCHRFTVIQRQYGARELDKKTLRALASLAGRAEDER